jgi:hypothetical protein
MLSLASINKAMARGKLVLRKMAHLLGDVVVVNDEILGLQPGGGSPDHGNIRRDQIHIHLDLEAFLLLLGFWCR